jgi:tetratricopeptide (TPR) repeat protein
VFEIDFEQGRGEAAGEILDQLGTGIREGSTYDGGRSTYADLVLDWMTWTGEWSRAEALLAPLATPASDAAEAAEGCRNHTRPPEPAFEADRIARIRAEAAAHAGNVAVTRRHLADDVAVRARIRPFLDSVMGKDLAAKDDSLAAIHRDATLATARRDDRALLAALRKIATAEDAMPGSEQNVGAEITHERIGDLLLRTGKAREAGEEYWKVLAKHPGRARALLGLARAAAKAGDAAASRDAYARLLRVWSGADAGFPGLDEAREAAGP